MSRDVLLCLWFTLVGAAFFGPYLGLPLPDLTALYGVFLLASVAALVLRGLRARGIGGRHQEGSRG